MYDRNKCSFILLRSILVPETTSNRKVVYMDDVDKVDYVDR